MVILIIKIKIIRKPNLAMGRFAGVAGRPCL
jgi:hypothetical protein